MNVTELKYKKEVRDDFMAATKRELQEHTRFRDMTYASDVKARYLVAWTENTRSKSFWEHDLSFSDITLLWKFRASCLGFAHNDPHYNNGSRVCRMCDEDVVESEEHVFLQCTALDEGRNALLSVSSWLRRGRNETAEQHLLRIGKTKKYEELAAFIRNMIKLRVVALERRNAVVRIIL